MLSIIPGFIYHMSYKLAFPIKLRWSPNKTYFWSVGELIREIFFSDMNVSTAEKWKIQDQRSTDIILLHVQTCKGSRSQMNRVKLIALKALLWQPN